MKLTLGPKDNLRIYKGLPWYQFCDRDPQFGKKCIMCCKPDVL